MQGSNHLVFMASLLPIKMEGQTFMLHHLGKQHWREMNAMIGADTSYRTQGRVEVPFDDDDLDNVTKWITRKKEEVGGTNPLQTRIIEAMS
ncbi:Uncharacterised protein [Cedecea neteri]|uniref:Uncharacterized protein n=1 Tax=Cedecea neteri TaxID=158822 RepID=A0A2X2T576_9ENTR|nr:Uncharacterised protein [Cedecea neteri]